MYIVAVVRVEPPAMSDVGLCSTGVPDTAVQKDIVKVTFVAEGNDVWTTVAKETMSAAREIFESASDVVVYAPSVSRPAVGEGQPMVCLSGRRLVTCRGRCACRPRTRCRYARWSLKHRGVFLDVTH